MNFKRVHSGEVSPELNQVAILAAWDAARILNLPVPRIQWVKRYPGELAGGWIDPRWPDVVHLAVDWCFSFRHTRTMIDRPDYVWRFRDYYA